MSADEKKTVEAQNWQLAHEWSEGLDLTHEGVDLADVLAYDVLKITGKLWLQAAVKEANDSA